MLTEGSRRLFGRVLNVIGPASALQVPLYSANWKGWRHIYRQKMHGFACDWRPNFLVGSLADVVSSCQVWFWSVHFCQRYGGKPSWSTQNDYSRANYSLLNFLLHLELQTDVLINNWERLLQQLTKVFKTQSTKIKQQQIQKPNEWHSNHWITHFHFSSIKNHDANHLQVSTIILRPHSRETVGFNVPPNTL